MLPAGLPVAVDTAVPATVFLAYSSLAAGFPSPADDYATKAIDLNAALIKHPQATFFHASEWRVNARRWNRRW